MLMKDNVDVSFETVGSKLIHPSLKENKIRFTELNQIIPDSDKPTLEKIKTSLLDLPLLHCTPSEIATTEPIVCSKDAGRVVGIGALDQSLGLDKFVYLSWGPANYPKSRDKHYLVNSSLLLDSSVVVTEGDITTFTYGSTNTPFVDLPHKVRGNIIRDYFGKMLTGIDWLELTARKILNSRNTGESSYMTKPPLHLGEIKVFRSVEPHYRLGPALSIEERLELINTWVEHGFNFGSHDHIDT